jgi:hypothetical protein
MAQRRVRVAQQPDERAVAHLVVARHKDDDTITTLCYEDRVAWDRATNEPLCQHCAKVLKEMFAVVTLA